MVPCKAELRIHVIALQLPLVLLVQRGRTEALLRYSPIIQRVMITVDHMEGQRHLRTLAVVHPLVRFPLITSEEFVVETVEASPLVARHTLILAQVAS